MTTRRTQVAEINLQSSQAQDYSAHVPVRLGNLTTAAFIDSGNTFANVISPQMMTALGINLAQLEPVPQLSIGTAAAGKRMKILGQAPRINLQLGQHPAKFHIRPLVLQGLVHPVNICDTLHLVLYRPDPFERGSPGLGEGCPHVPAAQTELSIEVAASWTFPGGFAHYTFRKHQSNANSTPLAARRQKPAWEKKLSRSVEDPALSCLSGFVPAFPLARWYYCNRRSGPLLGDNPILQEIQADGSLSILADNLETTDAELAPDTLIGLVQEVATTPSDIDPETSPPPEATTHAEFDALPQN